MRRRPPPPPPPPLGRAMSDRLGKPTCLIVASAAAAGETLSEGCRWGGETPRPPSRRAPLLPSARRAGPCGLLRPAGPLRPPSPGCSRPVPGLRGPVRGTAGEPCGQAGSPRTGGGAQAGAAAVLRPDVLLAFPNRSSARARVPAGPSGHSCACQRRNRRPRVRTPLLVSHTHLLSGAFPPSSGWTPGFPLWSLRCRIL